MALATITGMRALKVIGTLRTRVVGGVGRATGQGEMYIPRLALGSSLIPLVDSLLCLRRSPGLIRMIQWQQCWPYKAWASHRCRGCLLCQCHQVEAPASSLTRWDRRVRRSAPSTRRRVSAIWVVLVRISMIRWQVLQRMMVSVPVGR